ncbi:MAG: VOC family protein [Acidimicrobiales bacterium]
MPDVIRLAHVALTVSDLDRSVPWYEALFGAKPNHLLQGESFNAVVWSLGGETVVLHEFTHQPSTTTFDEHRSGLDHLAFACSSRVELEAWTARLDDLGVSHSEIVDASYGSGLSFRDPDNIALEIFASPAPATYPTPERKE